MNTKQNVFKVINDNLYLVLILFLPLSWVTISIGSVYRLVSVICFLIFMLKSGGKFQLVRGKKPLFMFWTLFFAHSMITYLYKSSTANTSIYGGMILLYLISLIFINNQNVLSDTKSIDICFIIAGVFFILAFFSGDRTVLGARESARIFGSVTDMNEFSSMFIILIPLCISYFFKYRNVLQRVILLIIILLSVYILFMAASRGAFIALAVTLMFTIWYEKILSPKRFFVLLIAGILLVFIFYKYIIELVPQANLARLTIDAIKQDQGSQREEIWQLGINAFFNGPSWRKVFGYGPYGISYVGHGSTLHNSFFQVLMDYGFVGLFYYLGMLLHAFKQSLKFNKVYTAAFVGIITISLTLSLGPSYKILWIMIFMFMLQKHQDPICENGI